MIISTFGFHLLKCNVSSTPRVPTTSAPTTNARKGLSTGLEPPSAKLQAGKAKNTLNRKCSARQKEGSHCGNWWAPCHILSLPLPSNAPSAAHVPHDLTTTTSEPFSSHHPDHPSSPAYQSIIVLKWPWPTPGSELHYFPFISDRGTARAHESALMNLILATGGWRKTSVKTLRFRRRVWGHVGPQPWVTVSLATNHAAALAHLRRRIVLMFAGTFTFT